MYALFAFAAALAVDLFVRCVQRPTTGTVAAASAAAWLLPAVHPYGGIVVAVEAAVALFLWRGRPLRPAWPAAGRGPRHDPVRSRRPAPGRPLRAELRSSRGASRLGPRRAISSRTPSAASAAAAAGLSSSSSRSRPGESRSSSAGGRSSSPGASSPSRGRRFSRLSSARAARPTSRRATSSSRCRSSPPSSEWRSHAFPGGRFPSSASPSSRRSRRRGSTTRARSPTRPPWASERAVAAPAAWLRENVGPNDVLYPYSSVFLAALPETGEARGLATGAGAVAPRRARPRRLSRRGISSSPCRRDDRSARPGRGRRATSAAGCSSAMEGPFADREAVLRCGEVTRTVPRRSSSLRCRPPSRAGSSSTRRCSANRCPNSAPDVVLNSDERGYFGGHPHQGGEGRCPF